jgi:hypothetical protein
VEPGADLVNEVTEHVVVRDEASGAALYLPPGWSRIDVDGFQLTVAAEDARQASAEGDTFRPNINVLVAAVDPAADVAVLGTAAVSAAMVTAEDVHVLAYEVWLLGDGTEGRRLMFAYRQGGSAVAVSQWVFASGGLSCTVTASCPVSALTAVGPALDYAVAGLELPAVAA